MGSGFALDVWSSPGSIGPAVQFAGEQRWWMRENADAGALAPKTSAQKPGLMRPRGEPGEMRWTHWRKGAERFAAPHFFFARTLFRLRPQMQSRKTKLKVPTKQGSRMCIAFRKP